MKKYILVLLMIVSPLMGQEKSAIQRRDYYNRPVFGLNFGIGGGYFGEVIVFDSKLDLKGSGNISFTLIPEFYLGKKVYFYLQLPLQFQGFYTHLDYDFFGLGVLLGMGDIF